MIEGVKRLSELRSARDIPAPAYCTTRCAHCPLHTAANTALRVRGAVSLVLGVPECSYYVKNIARGRAGRPDDLMNVVLDWHDVTFGCAAKLEAAFAELVGEYRPEAVFLITTCVPEITGDDVDSLAEAMSDKYGIPVPVVHTEHFKTATESSGTRNVISGCIEMMRPAERGETVNLLGRGGREMDGSELGGVLREAGVKIGLCIPDCSVRELAAAPATRLNLVTDANALPLAQEMERRFGVPYLHFADHIEPQRMLETYRALFELLGQPLPESVTAAHKRACEAVEGARGALAGKTYTISPNAIPPFELNAFLVDLGMRPLLIQTAEFPGREDEDIKRVLAVADPYVVNQTNPRMMEAMQNELKPDRNLGRGGGGGGRRGVSGTGFESIVALVGTLTGTGAPDARSGRPEGRHGEGRGGPGEGGGRPEGRHGEGRRVGRREGRGAR